MHTVNEELDRIVAHVARHGIGHSEPQLRRVATLASRASVQPAIASLLIDGEAPDVLRSRAFARVVAGLRAAAVRPYVVAAA